LVLAHFVKVYRSEDSKRTVSVFESSWYLWLLFNDSKIKTSL